MADMLVKLYALPPLAPARARLEAEGIEVRPGHASEKQVIGDWVERHFRPRWAVACEIGLAASPVTCYIAVEKDKGHAQTSNPYDLPSEKLLGFACYDVAAKGDFGPTGVREDYRKRGVGKALLLACLYAMLRDGYAYAIIDQVGPVEFYEKVVGATVIEGSEPGIVRGALVE